jgi:type II restriction enzyme
MIQGDLSLAFGYSNRTQQVRRISEDWVGRNGYCLRCDSDRIVPTDTNARTRDFVCEVCAHGYELRSKLSAFSNKGLDGAYGAMMRTIREGRTPTSLLLEYSASWSILRMRAIHHSLINETAIQAGKPLSATAKRAGWKGCEHANRTTPLDKSPLKTPPRPSPTPQTSHTRSRLKPFSIRTLDT